MGKTILYVEDNKAYRDTIFDQLVEEGYTVITAVDGKDAVEILSSGAKAPDLIITDLQMLRMSGIKLIQWVRGEWRHDQKIMLLTGNSSGLNPKNTKADQVVDKSVDIDLLLKSIKDLLD